MKLFIPVLLLVAVVVTFANSLQGGFHYDDIHSIVDNPHVRQLDDIGAYFFEISRFSVDPEKGMYRPIVLVSYALNYAWGGYLPIVFHGTNVVLHLICSFLVWNVAQAVGLSAGRALFAGLFFALHPLVTEPVNYVSSRSESLAACFLLAAFRIRLLETAMAERASLACFVCGLLSKSVVVVFPVLLFVRDVGVDGLSFSNAILRRWKFWVVTALYLWVISATGFLGGSLEQPVRSWDVQFWTQLKAIVKYVELVSLPVSLNVEHQFFESRVFWEGAVIASLVFVVSALAFVLRNVNGESMFWVAWIVICILPAAIIPLNVLVNEHRLYLPLVGVAIIFGRFVEHLRLPARNLCYVVIPVFSMLAFQRNKVWIDEISLWSAAAKKSPLMPRVHVELGNALRVRGDWEKARQRYSRALQLEEKHPAARTNLANMLYEEALKHSDKKLATEALQAAAIEYERVLENDPTYREVLNNLGNIYATIDEHDLAIEYYDRATQIYPNLPEAHFNRARSLDVLGRRREALKGYRRAAELMPEDADVFYQTGTLLFRMGDMKGALQAYRRAAAIEPTESAYLYVQAEILLAMSERTDSHFNLGKLREAYDLYRNVEMVSPGYRKTRERIAMIQRLLHE